MADKLVPVNNMISGGISFDPTWDIVEQQVNNSLLFNLGIEKVDYIDDVFLMDIAQSHFFTVSLSKLVGQNGKEIKFNVGEGTYKGFLPVKSIGVNYAGYDNMSVQLSILGDIQVLQRKKTPTLNITCYDLDTDVIERAVNAWSNLCFPENNYVAYIDDIKALFEYKSYDTKGVLNFTKSLWVIPTGSIIVNRDYSENNEKLVTFGVAAIGTNGSETTDYYGYNRSNLKVTTDSYGFSN